MVTALGENFGDAAPGAVTELGKKGTGETFSGRSAWAAAALVLGLFMVIIDQGGGFWKW